MTIETGNEIENSQGNQHVFHDFYIIGVGDNLLLRYLSSAGIHEVAVIFPVGVVYKTMMQGASPFLFNEKKKNVKREKKKG